MDGRKSRTIIDRASPDKLVQRLFDPENSDRLSLTLTRGINKNDQLVIVSVNFGI